MNGGGKITFEVTLYDKKVGGNTEHYIKQEAADEIYSKVMSVNPEKYRFYYGEFVDMEDTSLQRFMCPLYVDETITSDGEMYVRNTTMTSSTCTETPDLSISVSENRTNNVSSEFVALVINRNMYITDTNSIISEGDTGNKYVITLYYMEV